jgi:hypothetical protein
VDCTKKAYGSEQAARRAMSEMRGRRNRRDRRPVPTRAYHCQHCRNWHMTSEPKGDLRKRRSA